MLKGIGSFFSRVVAASTNDMEKYGNEKGSIEIRDKSIEIRDNSIEIRDNSIRILNSTNVNLGFSDKECNDKRDVSDATDAIDDTSAKINDAINLTPQTNCGNCGAGFSLDSLKKGACEFCGSAILKVGNGEMNIITGEELKGNMNKYQNSILVECRVTGNMNNIGVMIGGSVTGNMNRIKSGYNVGLAGNMNSIKGTISSEEEIMATLVRYTNR